MPVESSAAARRHARAGQLLAHGEASAEARRRLGHGQLDAAIAGFRQAEALSTDGEGRHRCLRDRRVAAIWLADDQPVRTHWSAWLRAATRRHPAAVAGEARGLDGPAGELVRLVAELLAGNVVAALALRHGPAGNVVAAPREPAGRPSLDATPAALGLRLLRAALRLAQQPDGWLSTLGVPPADAGLEAALELDRVGAEADAAGVAWLGRVARGARGVGAGPGGAAAALAGGPGRAHGGARPNQPQPPDRAVARGGERGNVGGPARLGGPRLGRPGLARARPGCRRTRAARPAPGGHPLLRRVPDGTRRRAGRHRTRTGPGAHPPAAARPAGRPGGAPGGSD